MTPNLISLQPNSVSLYPAGYYTRQIPIRLTARFPDGFTAAGAIPAKATGASYAYDATNYEVLVDSPILAGRYGKVWALGPRVNLNVFADKSDMLAATPEQIAAHKKLVDQAVATFGAQHYDHYEFLLSLSDQLGGIGLEHHRSSGRRIAHQLFHRVGSECPGAQPVAARVHPQLGWQVPPGCRAVDARFPHADARPVLVGV
jgi:predicted metalloprotease with PDZ domain